MDDEPMWAADCVVTPTPSFAITIPETANEFAIKGNHLTLIKGNQFDGRTKTDPHKHIHEFLGIYDMFKYRDTENEAVRLMMFTLSLTGEEKNALFDRLLGEIHTFSQHANESLTDAWLRMKEMLRNYHGQNLSKGNIIKIFYHGLNEITQEVLNAAADARLAKNQKTKSSPKKTVAFADESNSNSETDKIMAKMDAMIIKMDAQYKELQSHAKQPTPDLDDNDIPMSREEEAKFMQTFFGKFTFPADFVILEMEEDSNVPLILGRPFLHTVDAVIRVKQKQLNLRVGTERMIFNIDSAIKHSYSNDDTCFSINVIDEILEEDFDALLDERSKILHSIEGTILEEKIFSEFDKFIAMASNENYDSKSDEEELKFEKITINTNYKIKTSLEEPPTNLEHKPLLDNLIYVFLEEPSFLPVIISSQLFAKKKQTCICP
ncbi:reverse transcriptase domain-containing protein [Tanacetum coccineum]